MVRYLSGDDQAIQALIDRYHTRLLHFVVNYVSNRTAAEGVVQDTFARVAAEAASYDPQRRKFSTWLYMTARNLCAGGLRHRRKRILPFVIDPFGFRDPEHEYLYTAKVVTYRQRAEFEMRLPDGPAARLMGSTNDATAGERDEELEDLAEHQDELRVLVRQSVREQLKPLQDLVDVMKRWATMASTGAARFRDRREEP
jgi:RNA polymerase sigma factor (sigma-70 family)